MEITIPTIEGLPKEHFLNATIDALNRGGLIDEVYAASTIAGFSQFLAERPQIASSQDWISRAGQLVQGIEVNPTVAEGMYQDLVQGEKMELRPNSADLGAHRKWIFHLLSLLMLALSGLILYKIYMVHKSTGEVALGDVLLFVALYSLAILIGVTGYKKRLRA